MTTTTVTWEYDDQGRMIRQVTTTTSAEANYSAYREVLQATGEDDNWNCNKETQQERTGK